MLLSVKFTSLGGRIPTKLLKNPPIPLLIIVSGIYNGPMELLLVYRIINKEKYQRKDNNLYLRYGGVGYYAADYRSGPPK